MHVYKCRNRIHCKEKLVGLTTECLSTNWRDRKVYGLVMEDYLDNCPVSFCTDNPQNTVKEVLKMHSKVGVRRFHALNASR